MKLLAVTTDSHRTLYQDFFLPSLPQDTELLTHEMDLGGDGAYKSGTWQQGVVQKLKFALDHIRKNRNSIFILSDVDIQFFESFNTTDLLGLLEKSTCDILFQSETADGLSGEVNTGFYIARCTEYVESLMEKAVFACSSHEIANDQVAINDLLKPEDRASRWNVLPPTYYARSHGFPPPPDIVIHHANLTSTVEEKILQLDKIGLFSRGTKSVRFRIILKEALHYLASGKFAGMLFRRLKNLGS